MSKCYRKWVIGVYFAQLYTNIINNTDEESKFVIKVEYLENLYTPLSVTPIISKHTSTEMLNNK